MLHSECEGFTVNSPSLPFLNHVLLHRHTGVLYWSATSGHNELIKNAAYKSKVGKWVKAVDAAAAYYAIENNVVAKSPQGAGADNQGCVESHLIGTEAMVAWITGQQATNQAKPAVKKLMMRWLGAICEKAMLAHTRLSENPINVRVGEVLVTVLTNGDVHGWEQVMMRNDAAINQEWTIAVDGDLKMFSRAHQMLHFAVRQTTSPSAGTSTRTNQKKITIKI